MGIKQQRDVGSWCEFDGEDAKAIARQEGYELQEGGTLIRDTHCSDITFESWEQLWIEYAIFGPIDGGTLDAEKLAYSAICGIKGDKQNTLEALERIKQRVEAW